MRMLILAGAVLMALAPMETRAQNDPRRVAVGMTRAEAQRAWGVPDKVHSTVTAERVYEQWVYRPKRSYEERRYVYLENGVVTAVQR